MARYVDPLPHGWPPAWPRPTTTPFQGFDKPLPNDVALDARRIERNAAAPRPAVATSATENPVPFTGPTRVPTYGNGRATAAADAASLRLNPGPPDAAHGGYGTVGTVVSKVAPDYNTSSTNIANGTGKPGYAIIGKVDPNGPASGGTGIIAANGREQTKFNGQFVDAPAQRPSPLVPPNTPANIAGLPDVIVDPLKTRDNYDVPGQAPRMIAKLPGQPTFVPPPGEPIPNTPGSRAADAVKTGVGNVAKGAVDTLNSAVDNVGDFVAGFAPSSMRSGVKAGLDAVGNPVRTASRIVDSLTAPGTGAAPTVNPLAPATTSLATQAGATSADSVHPFAGGKNPFAGATAAAAVPGAEDEELKRRRLANNATRNMF